MTTRDIRTAHLHLACDVCGRTLLRGERPAHYLDGAARREVCELCTPRAAHAGWVREELALERSPRAAPGERRRSLIGRLRRTAGPRSAVGEDREVRRPAPDRAEAILTREPRHVRAMPTSAQQRVAAALASFNDSEHPRTIAGVARSLGTPFVVARALAGAGLVSIVVSWELCWYRYEVDLDGGPSVSAAGQGYELGELDPEDRVEPNAVADEYGTLAPA